LIKLIELLLKEWYVARHECEEFATEMVGLAEAKKKVKPLIASGQENAIGTAEPGT
jgi:hypothetical protein